MFLHVRPLPICSPMLDWTLILGSTSMVNFYFYSPQLFIPFNASRLPPGIPFLKGEFSNVQSSNGISKKREQVHHCHVRKLLFQVDKCSFQ